MLICLGCQNKYPVDGWLKLELGSPGEMLADSVSGESSLPG